MHITAFTSKGRIFTWGALQGSYITKPLDITLGFNLVAGEIITEVSYGASLSFALTSSGRLLTWQSNLDSPINLISNILDITNIVSYNFNEEIVDFIPMLEGYTLDGWYIDELLSIPYTKTHMPAEDITLYAKWIAN